MLAGQKFHDQVILHQRIPHAKRLFVILRLDRRPISGALQKIEPLSLAFFRSTVALRHDDEFVFKRLRLQDQFVNHLPEDQRGRRILRMLLLILELLRRSLMQTPQLRPTDTFR